jgi:hypothetical protein
MHGQDFPEFSAIFRFFPFCSYYECAATHVAANGYGRNSSRVFLVRRFLVRIALRAILPALRLGMVRVTNHLGARGLEPCPKTPTKPPFSKAGGAKSGALPGDSAGIAKGAMGC